MSGFGVGGMAAAVLCGLGLSGCAQLDPVVQDSAWQVTRSNAANLRAMIAVPGDLAYGAAAPGSDGHRATRAMERLRTDRVYPLPDVGISRIGGSGSAAPAPATE